MEQLVFWALQLSNDQKAFEEFMEPIKRTLLCINHSVGLSQKEINARTVLTEVCKCYNQDLSFKGILYELEKGDKDKIQAEAKELKQGFETFVHKVFVELKDATYNL